MKFIKSELNSTEELFKRMEDYGVDTKDFLNKHTLLEIIPDIVDALSDSIAEDYKKAKLYRHNTKGKLNQVIDSVKAYANYFWNRVAKKDEVVAEQYGELADDFLEELLNNGKLFKQKEQDEE